MSKDKTQSKIAFVIMKFDGDPWKDKRYQIICEVLEESDYTPLRADEISTSGPVVDEVCKYLKSADLVVVDSSGNSHSVSYEIGFCHGVGRSPNDIILLRNNDNIPFNYRHYRHRCYKDLRHLRRLLREVLGLSLPLNSEQLGYSFPYYFSEDYGFGYILKGACIVFQGRIKHFGGGYSKPNIPSNLPLTQARRRCNK